VAVIAAVMAVIMSIVIPAVISIVAMIPVIVIAIIMAAVWHHKTATQTQHQQAGNQNQFFHDPTFYYLIGSYSPDTAWPGNGYSLSPLAVS
jgi:hypothetical protein